jgi:hypothetical protein
MMPRSKLHLLPYLPIVLLPVILFSGPLIRFEALYWGTPGLQFIPWRAFIWDSLANGSFPLWNPYNGMGAPLIANYQTALFYPPSWLLYLFATIGGVPWMAWAHTLLVVFHLIWAGAGMVRLLHKLDLGILSQVIGAIAFALGGYLVSRSGFFSMLWAGSWLPWIILAASKIASPVRGASDSDKPFLQISLITAVALMLLAGHAQLSWYILLLAYFWVLVGGFSQKGVRGAARATIRYGVAVTIGTLLALIQLLPTAEYLLQSQRSGTLDYEAALSYSFWPWHFLTLLAPDMFGNPVNGTYWGYANYWENAIYIGLLPILMAFSTASMIWARERYFKSFSPLLVRFAWSVTVIGFLLALGRFTLVFPFLYEHIPTFDMFNGPARWLIWPLFGLSLLAAIGIDRWRTPTGKRLYWLRLSTAGGFAVTLGSYLTWFFLRDVSSTLIQATAMAGMWGLGTGLLTLFMPSEVTGYRRSIWQLLVVIWVCLDMLVAGWMLNPSIGMGFYQSTPDTRKNELNGKRVFLDIEDEDYLKFRRFFRFEDFRPLDSPYNLRIVMLPNLNLLHGVHSASNFDPIVPARYARWLKHLATLEPEERPSWFALMNVGLEEKLDMQESVGVRFNLVQGGERTRWYSCGIFVDGEEVAFSEVRNLMSENRFDAIVLEREGPKDICMPAEGNGDVIIYVDQPGIIKIRAEVPTAGWVFLADTWYPGWQAWVNGKKVAILRANYLFRAVEVNAGVNEIEFRYKPLSFILGASVSTTGWIIVLLSIIMMKIYSRRAEQSAL